MPVNSFIIKGNLCYSASTKELVCMEKSFAVCIDGKSAGTFRELPEKYLGLPVIDCGEAVVLPGLTDLHLHAPQYGNRGMAMDLELLDWLERYTFPEEIKFSDLSYAGRAYEMLVDELRRGATARACIFATIHSPATILLMDKLEESGLSTYVGKVNQDRNGPDALNEDTARSIEETRAWLAQTVGKYQNTRPIVTPRFVPSCTDRQLEAVAALAREFHVPVQSHLSENPGEIVWVKELCPWSETYGDAYLHWGLFGDGVPTIMAHCVWSPDREIALMKEHGVTVAHCPSSNCNLASGIAPAKRYLDEGIKIGLGTDLSAGESTSILRAIFQAVAMSKLRWRYVDPNTPPLSFEEAFWMATLGGGSFFGKVGSFAPGFAFDAVAIDDAALSHPQPLTLRQKLERIVSLSEQCRVVKKIVNGNTLF